ncbi:MAG: hypothetical protein FWD05_07935 [Oscillospiraceae bacterium]|nr:hypothetical protein [Oscillospiraceae bacterium]
MNMNKLVIIVSAAVLLLVGITIFLVIRNEMLDDLPPDIQSQQDLPDMQIHEVADRYFPTTETQVGAHDPTPLSASDALYIHTEMVILWHPQYLVLQV